MEKECKKHGLTEYVLNNQNCLICKKCRSENVIKERQNKKIKAVEYLGGKCVICGYDKCIGALEFHHKDPNEKDIDYIKIKSRAWGTLKTELDKCVLLCSNCHREAHTC